MTSKIRPHHSPLPKSIKTSKSATYTGFKTYYVYRRVDQQPSMLCPHRWPMPTVISFADLKIEPTAWLAIERGEIETSPCCGLPSFVSISAVFLLAAELTQFPAALAARGGSVQFGLVLTKTVYDLFYW